MRECIACGNSGSFKEFTVREMMFGMRDQFTYLECSNCGCLQIKQIPENLGKYYPDTYYSFKTNKESYIKVYLTSLRDKYSYGIKNLIGKILSTKYPPLSFVPILKLIDAKLHWKILDIGSGSGGKLLTLRRIGFTNLLGIDPYIEKDINYKNGVKIQKKSLFELSKDDKFDLVMLHHVFEHLERPIDSLRKILDFLKVDGKVLIRIPVAGSHIWEKYKNNWVQLDAPRHLVIPTEKSMYIMADIAGYNIVNVFYDSSSFQFWGSEQYWNDIPLNDPRSYSVSPQRSIFGENQIIEFEKEARKLNLEGKGDQACFILQRKT